MSIYMNVKPINTYNGHLTWETRLVIAPSSFRANSIVRASATLIKNAIKVKKVPSPFSFLLLKIMQIKVIKTVRAAHAKYAMIRAEIAFV